MPMAAIYFATLALAQRLPEAPAELVIETTPRAEIFLDEVRLGQAAENGSFVHRAKPGPHVLRITLRDKQTFTQKIAVVPGQTRRIRADLADFTGDLEIFTTPNAEILIDGKSAGVADGSGRLLVRGLKVMSLSVRAGRAGYNSQERRVAVVSGVVSSLTMELKRIEAADESATTSLPDYLLHRRLVAENYYAARIFFRANSLQLVSFGFDGNPGSRSRTGYIIEWDAGTGRLLKTTGLEGGDSILCVSPDLRWVAMRVYVEDTKPNRGTALTRLVDAGSGRVVREWRGYAVTFSPDSKRLVILDEHTAEASVWDVTSGKRLQTWQDSSLSLQIVYGPDGRWVATGREGVTIRDAETGKEVRRLPVKDVRALAASPNGRWLAVATYSKKIELWEADTGRQGRTIEADSESAVFTPDSRSIVSMNDNDLRLFDTFTGREVRKWQVESRSDGTFILEWAHLQQNLADRIVFSPDGRWLVVAGYDLTVWKRAE